MKTTWIAAFLLAVVALFVVVLFLGGGLVGATARRADAGREARPASPAAEEGDEAVRLRRAIEALVARLEERDAADALAAPERRTLTEEGQGGPPASAELAALRAEVSAVTETLAEVRAELDSLALALRAGARQAQVAAARAGLRGEELEEVLQRNPRTNWKALEEYVGRWDRDEETARTELLFLGPADVLERFGVPSSIHPQEDGSIRWIYRRPDAGPLEFTCSVVFAADRVSKIYVRPS